MEENGVKEWNNWGWVVERRINGYVSRGCKIHFVLFQVKRSYSANL